jgi:hypothetical protein
MFDPPNQILIGGIVLKYYGRSVGVTIVNNEIYSIPAEDRVVGQILGDGELPS